MGMNHQQLESLYAQAQQQGNAGQFLLQHPRYAQGQNIPNVLQGTSGQQPLRQPTVTGEVNGQQHIGRHDLPPGGGMGLNEQQVGQLYGMAQQNGNGSQFLLQHPRYAFNQGMQPPDPNQPADNGRSYLPPNQPVPPGQPAPVVQPGQPVGGAASVQGLINQMLGPQQGGPGSAVVGYDQTGQPIYIDNWNALQPEQMDQVMAIVSPYSQQSPLYGTQPYNAAAVPQALQQPAPGVTPQNGDVSLMRARPGTVQGDVSGQTGMGLGPQGQPGNQPPGNQGQPGGQGNQPHQGGGSTLMLSPQGEAVRRGLDDELAGTLTRLGVQRDQIPAMVKLMTARLESDQTEDLRQTDEAANARGVYNSGMRTTNRHNVTQGYDRQRQDLASNIAQQFSDLAQQEADARSRYNQGLTDLLLSLANDASNDPNYPTGSSGSSKGGKNKGRRNNTHKGPRKRNGK